MTPNQKRLVRTSIVTTAIGLAALFGTWLVTTGWTSKLDVSTYRLDRQRDSLWRVEQRAMTLDVLCAPAIDPNNRRCRQ